jgi:hypothetical protein
VFNGPLKINLVGDNTAHKVNRHSNIKQKNASNTHKRLLKNTK